MNSRHILILLFTIFTFALGTRLYRLSEPKSYIFDEVYHAVTAKLYARNDPRGYEWWHEAPEPNTAIEWLHPPIAKLFQAESIRIFGENSFGWRISSVVFGIGVIFAVFYLTLQLTKAPTAALIAAFLSSLDGLLFVQSRIAMNDIHVTFFILITLIMYVQWKKDRLVKNMFFTGLLAGLSVSTKWSGIFVIGILFFDQLIEWFREWKLPVGTIFTQVIAWIAIPAIVYVASYGQFWLQGHTWAQFKELHRQIWWYQTHLTATHNYQSKPWQWVLDLRPVWMYVNYPQEGKIANIYNLGNPVIFYAGLASIVLLIIELKFNKKQGWKWEYSFIVLSYLLVWIPWIASPRIMFFYHYTPAVPFLCIALGIQLNEFFKERKMSSTIVASSVLALALGWFVVFYPNLTGIPVPTKFADTVYFGISSWK